MLVWVQCLFQYQQCAQVGKEIRKEMILFCVPKTFFFFCCGIERGVEYHFFLQIKVENYGIVKTFLKFSVYIKIISINTGGQTYQVLPFDAFLLPQPVEAAVRDTNER